jgi:predicted NBD/HSP70 family sugar kinase
VIGSGPLRHGAMRERNLAVLLAEVAAHQPITRAGLAVRTGFTKTTVSNLLAVLGEAGLVRDGDRLHERERGRPGVAVSLRRSGAAGLGLEVGVDYLSACLLDLGRRVCYRHTVEAANRGRPPAQIAAALADLAAGAAAAADEQGLALAGTVVALPGVLDQNGTVYSPNLGWSGAHPQTLLAGRLPATRLPDVYDNEANLAALGELWFGLGPSLGDFLHVSGEIGIGAGIIVDGQVFRGAHGLAGELGHIVVDPGGALCECGSRGCLERVAGQEAILRAAGLGDVETTGAFTEAGSLAVLLDRLRSDDPRARAAVRAAGRYLGLALGAATKLLDPDTVVLGGIFSPLSEWVAPVVEGTLRDGALYGSAPSVVVSPLGRDAAVLGAAGVVIERIYADPALLLR